MSETINTIIIILCIGFLLYEIYSIMWTGRLFNKPVKMKEVWSKQNLIRNKGNLANSVKSELKNEMNKKNITNLQIFEGHVGLWGRDYIYFQRRLGLGFFTSTAVSIELHGTDLAIDIRQNEISVLGTGSNLLRLIFGIAFIGAGLLTIELMGAGIILIVIGIIIMPWKINTELADDLKVRVSFYI